MLFTVIVCVGIAFVVLLLCVLVLVLLDSAAKNKQQATYVQENTAEFVVAGGKLLRPLLSVPKGQILTKNYKLVEKLVQGEKKVRTLNPLALWLRTSWGFYWVSLFWPLRKIHKFKITKERLNDAKRQDPKARLRDMIESDDEPTEVDHLRLKFQRPFLFEQVETKENFEVDIILLGFFRVVDLVQIPFVFKERFFPSLKAAISGALMDWIKDLKDYEDFRTQDKGKGSDFSRKMKAKLVSLAKDLGVEVEDIWVEVYELVSDKDVRSATQAKAVAILKGDAEVEAAKRRFQAAEDNAKAEAAPVTQLVAAYKGNAELANLDMVTRNLGQKSGLTTLVMGGVTPNLTIGGGGTNRPPAVPTPPTTTTPTTSTP